MTLRRWPVLLLAIVVLLATAAVGGFYFATRALKSQVLQALGPNAEIGAIDLHWNAVEINNLVLHAPPGWPTQDELRARQIRIEPELAALLQRRIRIASITVRDGYISLLRGADGRLRLLPSLLEKPKPANVPPTALPPISIGRVSLDNDALDFFDASLGRPPHRIRLEALQAQVEDIALPEFKGHTTLALQGLVKGVRSDGEISIKGWFEIASLDSRIESRLRKVDLIALQPYLVKAADTGVKRGTLDLDLASTVSDKRLHAAGTVTLNGLELDERSGTVLGMPRKAVVSLMQDRDRKIPIHFELDGRLDDPRFKLNESIAARLGSGFAEALGISFEGIAKGAGSVGNAVGEAAQGVGKALKGLFGK